jgi:hypothetical protein
MRWEDPETQEKLEAFAATLGSLGTRQLLIGPLDGRNHSDIYAVGDKKSWKLHLRRQQSRDEDLTIQRLFLNLDEDTNKTALYNPIDD